MVSVSIHDEQELRAVAEDVLRILAQSPERHVVTLKGDLGAGKTAFTKALGSALGVAESVTSPTFVIMKSYPLRTDTPFKTLTHVDAYRIEDEDELRVLNFDAVLNDPDQLVVIEWPERILGLIPPHTLALSIMIGADNSRHITYGE